MSLSIPFDSAALAPYYRYLKRSNLKRAALYLKLFILLLCLLAIGITAYRVIANHLELAGEAKLVEGQIYQKVNAIKATGTVKAKDFDSKKIASARIFGELGKLNSLIPLKPEETKSNIQGLSLVGTFLDGGAPLAIILASKSKEQDIFSIDQSVFDSATLIKIASDYVELDQDGKTIRLNLDDGGGVENPGGGTSSSGGGDKVNLSVDSAKLEDALDNLPLTLTQARAVPYFKNGKSVGLRLFAIKNDSIFSDIGLKNGDILKDINGNSLADMSQAIKLFEKLRDERSLSLKLERARKDVTYSYDIK